MPTQVLHDPISPDEAFVIGKLLAEFYHDEVQAAPDESSARTRAITRMGAELDEVAKRQLSEAEWNLIFDAELAVVQQVHAANS